MPPLSTLRLSAVLQGGGYPKNGSMSRRVDFLEGMDRLWYPSFMRTKTAPKSLNDRITSIGYGVSIGYTAADDADLLTGVHNAWKSGTLVPSNFPSNIGVKFNAALQRLRSAMKTSAGREAGISHQEIEDLFEILKLLLRWGKLHEKIVKMATTDAAVDTDLILGLWIPKGKVQNIPGIYHDETTYYLDWDLASNRGKNPVGVKSIAKSA